MERKFDVIVVGAGPVGMTCALALFKRGISVCVVEKDPEPVIDQRAASIHPPTLEMLDDLGVARDIIPRGLKAPTFQYHDRASGERVAAFDLALLKDEFRFPFVLQYEQYKLSRDIAETFSREAGFDALYAHAFAGVEHRDDHLRVAVDAPDGAETFQARYLVGADGGRSDVRRAVGIEFEGFTYDERFIKIATEFDFQSVHPEYAYRNYFSDPEEWCNLFRVRGERPEGLWRAIFPTRVDETEEGLAARGRADPDAEILPPRRRLPGGILQRLYGQPTGGQDLPGGAGVPGRGCGPCQQSHWRDGHERRHPRRGQPGGQARSGGPRRGR